MVIPLRKVFIFVVVDKSELTPRRRDTGAGSVARRESGYLLNWTGGRIVAEA